MPNILFFGDYTKAGVGTAPSSAPTITIYSVVRSSGVEALVESAQATVASAMTGRYYYQFTTANLQLNDYHARFHTSDSTVDQQDLPALWTNYSLAVTTDASGDVTPTAGAIAAVATAIWTDLVASSDFSTTASVGANLKATISATGGVLAPSPESLTGTVVSATTTSVTFSAGVGTVFNATANAYASVVTRYLTFTSGANKGLTVAVTSSSVASSNLTVGFAATTGVIAATAGDTVQLD